MAESSTAARAAQRAWTDTERTYGRFAGDAAALARELEREVDAEVRFGKADRALYATDASNFRQVPIGVVVPRSVDGLVAAVAACRRHGAPIVNRGGGTSLAGQCCNVAVVLDCSKHLDQVLEVDPRRRIARVQPGCRLDDLRAAAKPHGLNFGPDPATHAWCTLGGMIGNNSCGVHAQLAGKTEDNVEELEVLTYDGLRLRAGRTEEAQVEELARLGGRRGELYAGLRALRERYAERIRERFPPIPRRVSGYNLPQLLPENGFHLARALVGTEGTCATTLEATVRLVPWPRAQVLLLLGYSDVFHAGDHVPEVLEAEPMGLEGLDDRLLRLMRQKHLHDEAVGMLPQGRGFLMVELGGDDRGEAEDKARALMSRLRDGGDHLVGMLLFLDPHEQEQIWHVRESGLGATAHTHEGDAWPGWEDSAVPPERVGGYLRELRALYDRHGLSGALYGHFGQGCIHTRIDFQLGSKEGIVKYRAFLQEAAELCLSFGGSLSGEHGDGQQRGELLPRMFGEDLCRAFSEFKALWDPDWRMNPGKVVEPYRLDENLRLGTEHRPPRVETHFRFPDDDGSFAHATLRCVGVGKCRRTSMEAGPGSVMCPSYVATREEAHSTRGRARLLWEMLNDRELDGWKDEGVHGALDLCLACKGCKSDCPVDVDMATYKAEFLAHYYEGRMRPREAYALGLIYWWARAASKVPWLANFVTQTPGLRSLAKKAAHVAPQRRIPPFATRTFVRWFRRRPRPISESTGEPRPRVLLWPDTFNNHLKPDVAIAAVEVLEEAGYRVTIPPRPLCCGRPLYDFGWIERARKLWLQTLEVLREDTRAGVPVVVLEPSCAAAFRDELLALLPRDEDAQRLAKQTHTLDQLLVRTPGWRPPRMRGQALVHGHCHHRSILGLEAEEQVLDGTGLDYEVLASTCCGMAGAFGFEKGKYDLSVKVAEHVLLPAVRAAQERTLLISDGFSCREQIEQLTPRKALHLAQVLRMGLRAERERSAEAASAGARP